MNFTELNKFFINYLAHIPLQVGYFFYIKKKDGAINNIFLYQDFFQYENFFFIVIQNHCGGLREKNIICYKKIMP